MKRKVNYRKDGTPINVLIPESKADIAELQRLYDEGKLQAGDHVKQPSAQGRM
jgi:hypothetical protein